MAVFDPEGMLRVHNNSSDPVFVTYHSRTFRIAPNSDGFVPFTVVQYYFGDPRSSRERTSIKLGADKVGFIPSREEELNRLSILYGLYDANAIDEMRNRVPKLTVYSVEDGEQVVLPLDDPKCLEGQFTDGEQEGTFIEQQLHSLRQQQLILQQMLENREHESSERAAFLPEDQSIAASMRKPLKIPVADSETDGVEEDKPNILIP